jgi:poly-gamma-glutamate synthesis protein (capsule biosynthesis protein)
MFAGDVHFAGPLQAKLAADPNTVLAPIAPVLENADIAMVNLESAITTRGTPVPRVYNFRAPPNALTALGAAGIDVATEANNHGLDYGPVGLLDTLAARAASKRVAVIGIGRNAADAYAPYRATINGERIAIIAAAQFIDPVFIASWTATDTQPGIASAINVPRLLQAVAEARATSDTVVVYLHWGLEGTHCPIPDQTRIAAQLVAAGADIVIGSHSHQLEGAGHLGNALIDYGLGNFAFYTGTTTGVLTVTMTGRHVDRYGWIPAQIVGGVPNPVTGPAAANAIAAWRALRDCTNLSP